MTMDLPLIDSKVQFQVEEVRHFGLIGRANMIHRCTVLIPEVSWRAPADLSKFAPGQVLEAVVVRHTGNPEMPVVASLRLVAGTLREQCRDLQVGRLVHGELQRLGSGIAVFTLKNCGEIEFVATAAPGLEVGGLGELRITEFRKDYVVVEVVTAD